MLDSADVQVVLPDAEAPQGIGVGLDFRCPRGATLVALAAEDDVVWSPLKAAAAPELAHESD
jgi:hypothetical protein